MTIRIGTYDAKSRLSELLDRVESGEDVIITRNGKPVARLIQENGDAMIIRRRAKAANRLRALRAGLTKDVLEGTSIRSLVEDGRR